VYQDVKKENNKEEETYRKRNKETNNCTKENIKRKQLTNEIRGSQQ
jgi:hypothetical protein